MAKKEWHPDFAPCFSPEEMLKKGVFEGKYINAINGLPSSWYKLPKVLGKDDKPDPGVNQFEVKSRKSLSEWKKNGWIMTDKNGWFEWYCHYYLGRRLGKEDETQVKRWKSFCARHMGGLKSGCQSSNLSCQPVRRQGLLQWAWDSTKPFDEEQLKKNQEKLKRHLSISIEAFSLSQHW